MSDPIGVGEVHSAPRKPWAAALLSFLIPGLGQLYAGLPWRALIAVLLAFAAELLALPMALTLRGGFLLLLLCHGSHSLTLQGRIVFRARRCNRDFS